MRDVIMRQAHWCCGLVAGLTLMGLITEHPFRFALLGLFVACEIGVRWVEHGEPENG